MAVTPFIGEIQMFAGNFAVLGWAHCNGQLLPISQYDALFALIGTTYGGDGQTTFALPNLQGRVPVHQGTGPGLSTYVMGQAAGTESVTLTANAMPAHTHPVMASGVTGTAATPGNAVLANGSAANTNVYKASNDFTAAVALNAGSVLNAGGNQPHDNIQPYLALNFLIALEGIFPQRN